MKDSFALRAFILLIFLVYGGPLLFAQAPLREGDTVEIRISGVPAEEQAQFTASYTVDSEGMLNLPFIGPVRAAGMKPAQVATFIENNLKTAQIYTNPTITVQPPIETLTVNVRGAVKAPQRVVYTPDMTLMIAITAAGGPNDFAGNEVRLTRDGKSTKWNLKEIRRRPSTDPKLLPGDQVELFQSLF